ncbi:hypothetical protein MRX96_029857 [Rhipicephalus microplus]
MATDSGTGTAGISSRTKANKRRYCCVKDCHSREGQPGIRLYRFPGQPWEKERRRKWIVAVRRVNEGDGSAWIPSDAARVASEFEEKWDMSHCLGAIDGKHVIVECPANSRSRDRNYKGSFSKSLMAISDANYSFLYVEIGHNGSESDGGIFSRSKLQPLVPNGTLGIPPVACLGSIGNVPYFLLVTRHFL